MNTSDTITFLLDGKLHQIKFDGAELKPSTTVLNYLRLLHNHKGVKEGCAEGDCGACTVVVADLDEQGNLVYEAIDSCLVLLPMIHGRQLITVENLKDKSYGESALHPVQESMVKLSGSQCGYCTPGFVMSMFALYKKQNAPSREVVLDALTGNLCRCTGYRPIVDATHQACCHHGKDHFSPSEKQVCDAIATIKNTETDLELQGGGQTYYLPACLSSALLLREQFPNAILVNGATDVALRQTKKNEHFPLLIDLSAIKELKTSSRSSSQLTLGAGMNLEKIRLLVKDELPALYEMLVVFGSLQIRNMATLGGNVGSASPISDTIPILFAYEAIVNLAHTNGINRSLPVEEFITGYRQTALLPGELIVSVSIPISSANTLVKSYKVSRRRDLDISTVCAAFALQTDIDNKVSKIIMAYGGMAEKTQRATAAESFLTGKEWNKNNILQAMKILEKEFEPISDARAAAEARTIAASNLLLKFFLE